MITLKRIYSDNMNLPLVISDSMGYPSDEKVKQVLQSYTAKICIL